MPLFLEAYPGLARDDYYALRLDEYIVLKHRLAERQRAAAEQAKRLEQLRGR